MKDDSGLNVDGGFSQPGDAAYGVTIGVQRAPEVQLPLVAAEVTAIGKRNILNQAQTFRLITFLMGKVAELDGLSDKEVADMASKELSFTVADNNISGIRLNPELPELTWNPSRIRTPKASDMQDHVRIEDFRLFMTSYLQLLRQLELEPSPGFMDMARKYI